MNALKCRSDPGNSFGTVLELFRIDYRVVRSARIKQGDRLVQLHSLKHLYTLELPLSPDVEGESAINSPFPHSSATPGNDVYSSTSSGDENIIWLCSVGNAPQGDKHMIVIKTLC